MNNFRYALALVPLFLSACGHRAPTLDDFLKNPQGISTAMQQCDNETASILQNSTSDSEMASKMNAIQAGCQIAVKANDIRLAGNGVIRVFDAEPMPNADAQDFKDAAEMDLIAKKRQEIKSYKKAVANSDNSFARSVVQSDERTISFALKQIKNPQINVEQVQAERQWCHQQSLYRNISADKVSAACKSWGSTMYTGTYKIID